MKTPALAALSVATCLAVNPAQAQQRQRPDSTARTEASEPRSRNDDAVVTHGRITINGAPLAYTTKTGMMPIRGTSGVVEGNIFYVYYKKDGATGNRPLTFVFNGGPGSSTVWLHMGAFGPKIVRLKDDGTNPPPPYTLRENQNTLLDQTDLVFLDPVGTGYSRATKPEYGPNFWGLDEDVRSVGEFVRLFLTKEQRWGSPKFLAGESYGTTRAAHLSGWLTDNGIALNGIALISTVLNFQVSRQANGNDLGWLGYFPTYTATAWYHKRLPADLQAKPLATVLREVERWADSDYILALNAGNKLAPATRQKIANDIARYTGLSKSFVEQNNLRISLQQFVRELQSDKQLRVGRLDTRFTSFVSDASGQEANFDPSDASIRNSFTAVWNDYVRDELKYVNDDTYYILGGGIGPWRYPQGVYADVTPSLERALAKNPDMHVYVAEAFYDGATPYWAVEYTLNHLRITPEARKNITQDYFESGHMMYIESNSMAKLRNGMRNYMEAALKN